MVRLAGVLPLLVLCGALSCSGGPMVAGLENGLARIPPRGWRSWNAMTLDISQESILAQARAMAGNHPDGKQPGLKDFGYVNVGIDDGWQDCGAGANKSFHDAKGFPIWNSSKFPSPKTMVKDVHALGLKMGWYQNNCWCHETQFLPSGGHPAQDSAALHALGFDGVKIDGCGPQMHMDLWSADLSKAGPVLIEDCLDKSYWSRGELPPVPTPELLRSCPGNFFRISRDIAPQFLSAMFNINFGQRLLAPYLSDPALAPRPGCWAYGDMLQVGNLATRGEDRTHFAAWVVTSSPLVLGFDLTNHTTYSRVYPIITNPRALEISSAWAGCSGRLRKNASTYFVAETAVGAHNTTPAAYPNQTFADWQIWSKPMPTRGLRTVDHAILIINLRQRPQNISLSLSDVDTKFASAAVIDGLDVWSGEAVQLKKRGTSFHIDGHDSRFLRVWGMNS